jgi:hypothetical protein
MWLRFDATTLWHFDAAEWAPSTTSFATDPSSAGADRCPLCPNSDRFLRRCEISLNAKTCLKRRSKQHPYSITSSAAGNMVGGRVSPFRPLEKTSLRRAVLGKDFVKKFP